LFIEQPEKKASNRDQMHPKDTLEVPLDHKPLKPKLAEKNF
jgi:hypothetical protein